MLEYRTEDTVARKFDFSKDYEVINLLGQTIFDRALQIRSEANAAERNARLQEAVDVFRKTLAIDSENVDAHYNLSQLYSQLGDSERPANIRHCTRSTSRTTQLAVRL